MKWPNTSLESLRPLCRTGNHLAPARVVQGLQGLAEAFELVIYIYIWYPPPSCIYRLSLVLLQVTLLHYDYKQRGSRSWLLSFVVLSLLLLSLWVCQCLRNETPKTLVLPMIPMISGQSPQRPRADRLKIMEIMGIIGITNVSGEESWKSLVFTNGCDIHHSRNIGFTNGFDIQPARNIGFTNGLTSIIHEALVLPMILRSSLHDTLVLPMFITPIIQGTLVLAMVLALLTFKG